MFRDFFPEVLENRIELGVDGACSSAFYGRLLFLLVEVVILHNLEGNGLLEECRAFRSDFYQSEILNLAVEVTGDYGLSDYGVESAAVGLRERAEYVEVLVVVIPHFGGLAAADHVDNMFCLEFIFQSRHGFEYGGKFFFCVHLFFRV